VRKKSLRLVDGDHPSVRPNDRGDIQCGESGTCADVDHGVASMEAGPPPRFRGVVAPNGVLKLEARDLSMFFPLLAVKLP
jgi:hypothetical protein